MIKYSIKSSREDGVTPTYLFAGKPVHLLLGNYGWRWLITTLIKGVRNSIDDFFKTQMRQLAID
mgnify:CR=1 FL=1